MLRSILRLRSLFFLITLTATAWATAPTISSTSPATNNLHVTATANITITFNQSMDNATLTSSTIKVHGNYRGYYSGSFSYGANSTTFNPDSSFKPGEIITVSVTTGVQNAGNESMTTPRVFDFTVDATAGFAKFHSPVNYTAYGTGSGNHYTVLADLDNDGDIDIASTTSLYNVMSVMLNNGDGTYASAVTYTTLNGFDICAADVDGDGDMDLLVANNSAHGLSVFINNGSGSFSTRNDYDFNFPQSNAQFLVPVDIDGDGDIDVVTNDLTYNYLHVMKNNGSGVFSSTGSDQLFTTRFSALAVGDLDKDGDMDILATCASVDSVEEMINDGTGNLTFSTRFYWISTNAPTAALIADINSTSGDKKDIVWLNGGSNLLTYFKDGSGIPLFTADNVSVGGYPVAVNAVDVDSDNDLDLVVANYNDATFSLLSNTGSGSGTFSTTHTYAVPSNPDDLATADLDGDGDMDIVTINNDATVSVFANYNGGHVASMTPANGSLDFSAASNIVIVFDENIDSGTLTSSTVKLVGSISGAHTWTLSSYVSGTHTATINPTIDFKPGEVVTIDVSTGIQSSVGINLENGFSSQFVVAAGDGAVFGSKTDYSVGTQPKSVIAVDLNSDGYPDIVAVNSGSDNISVRLNNGDGTYASEAVYSTGDNPTSVAAGDVDGDGDIDLVVTETNANQLARFLNNGSGIFGSETTYSTSASPVAIKLVDTDNDGDLDVVYTRSASQMMSQQNNGSGAFSNEWGWSSGDSAIVSADIDNDGDLDIIATSYSGFTPRVYVYANGYSQAYGYGYLASSSNYTVDAAPTGVVAADFNGDGYADIVTSNLNSGNGTINYLQNNQNGTFASKVAYSVGAGSEPRGITAMDIDGDGDLDVVVANGAGDAAKVFINNGSGVFSDGGQYTTGGNPYSIASADLNNDGIMDVVTANYSGDNTSVLMNALTAPTVTTSAATSITTTGATVNGIVNAKNLTTAAKFAYKLSSSGTYADTIAATPTGFAGGANTNVSAALSGLLENTSYDFKAVGINAAGTATGSALSFTTLESAIAVASTSPTRNALDVASSTNITVTFNVPTNSDSLNAANVIVNGSMSGRIAGSISYDGPSKTMTFDPTSNFHVGEEVSITLTHNIVSSSGASALTAMNRKFTVAVGGTGVGHFEVHSTSSFFGRYEQPALAADVDNDGDEDLIAANGNGFAVCKNNGSGFDASVASNLATDIQKVIYADMDGDGFGDLVVQKTNNSSYIVILKNNGSGTFALWDSLNTGTPYSYYGIEVKDFNNDGKNDIAYIVPDDPYVLKVAFNTPGWSNTVTRTLPAGDHKMASGDIDNDGDIDFVFGCGGAMNVVKNNGNGTFAAAVTYALTYSPYYVESVVVQDFNGDGYADVMTMGGADYHQFGISMNNGDGTFADASAYALGIQPAKVSSGDLDGDGDIDLVFSYQNETTTRVAYNNGSGLFNQVLPFTATLGGFQLIDADNDGDLDIVGSYNNTLDILENTIVTSPSTAASNFIFDKNYGSSMRLNWDNGNGTSRIVVMKQGGAVDTDPTNNVTYTGNASFGSGTQLGSGNYVVYNGTGSSINISGLSVSTSYYFTVYEYNGTAGSELYGTTSPGTASNTTNSVAGIPFDTTAGKALAFDGGNNYPYTDLGYGTLPNGFTMEMWVKPNAIGNQMVFMADNSDEFFIGINSSGNFFSKLYDTDAASDVTVTGSTTTAVAGQWYHIAVTGVAGGNLVLYVNGVQEASAGITLFDTDRGSRYWLGSDNNENYYYNGTIDEVRLWSTIRSVSDIRSSMHKTLSGNLSNLTFYFQFNEQNIDNNYTELVNDIVVGDFDNQSEWVTSTAPVGGATITSTTSFQNGTAAVGNATLTMADGFDNPVDVYVSEVTAPPSNYPSGYGSSVGNKYFVINLFGDPGTFSANISFTFGPGVISPAQEADPGSIQLAKRESNSSGSWTSVGGAVSAVSATGEVTWNGITSFSQFLAISSDNELPPSYTITKPNNADWTLLKNQDRITDNVWLTRGSDGGLFNINSESSFNNSTSPAGTEWAIGKISDGVESLEFSNFRDLRNSMSGSLQNLPGHDAVLHLIAEDIYLDVHFNSWSIYDDGAGFSYTRSLLPLEVHSDGLSTPVSITPTSATVKGWVYSKNNTATAYIVYGTASGSYTDSVAVAEGTIPLDTVYTVTSSLTGLSTSTTYYYRISLSSGSQCVRSMERTITPHSVQTWSKNNGTITFTKAPNADFTLTANQDRLSQFVSLTRGNTQGIFNILSESNFEYATSPAGTEWAFGTTDDLNSLTFYSWTGAIESVYGEESAPSIVGQDMVVHLIDEDIYLDVKFTSWSQGGGGGGGFSYDRAASPLNGWTNSATGITYNAATVNGSVYSKGLTATAYFLYGTTNGVYLDSIAATPGSIDSSAETTISANLSSLAEGTTYYYSVAARNSSYYIRGSSRSFTTYSSTIGSALKFDGNNDYVSVNTGVATLSAPYTVEAWLNPLTTSGTNCFFDTRSPSEYGFDVKLIDGNTIHADIGDGSNWLTTDANASYNYAADEWVHVAYVVTTTGYTIYINGVASGSGSFSGTPILYSSDHNIKIGSQGGGGEFFNGVIDEMRVWNVARTEQEIQDNMNVRFTSAQSGLAAYWQFNEISGTTANELIADADGTLNNFNFNDTDGWVLSTSPLSVELTSFTISSKRLNAELKWKTATEIKNYGYEIQRSAVAVEKGKAPIETKNWTKVGFVEGNGTTNVPKEYSYTDKVLKAGNYSYRLKQIDRDGKFSYSTEIQVEVGAVPLVFALEQNYPNPFNPTTTIGFTLQQDGMTTLKVYNTIGQEVATLVNENLKAGEFHQTVFNARGYASGVYFVRLISSGKVQLKKMLLVK